MSSRVINSWYLKKRRWFWRLYFNYDTTGSCQIYSFSSVSRFFKKFRLKIISHGWKQIKHTRLDFRKKYWGGSICTFYKWNLESSPCWIHLKAIPENTKGFLRKLLIRQQKVTSVSHLAKLPMISPHSRLLTLPELEAFRFMNSSLS